MSEAEELVHCDAVGCDETHPRFHKERGPGFKDGKWLGWFYLDINRPDIIDRTLRFHSLRCLVWWLVETKTATLPWFHEGEREGLLFAFANKPQ